jgi:phage-related protein
MEFAQEAWDALKGGFSDAKQWFTDKVDAGKETIIGFAQAVSDKYGDAKQWFGDKIDGLKQDIVDAATALKDKVVGVKDAFVDKISEYWETIKQAGTDIVNWVTSLPKRIFEGAGDLASAAKDTVVNFSKQVINAFIDELNKLIDGMNGIYPSWAPGPDNPFGHIGHLATGTGYFHGGLAVVGETGPELAFLPRGAEVWPAPRTQAVLSEITARNMTLQSKPQVNLTLHFHGVNGISEAELARVKAELVKAITDVLDD